MKPYGYPLYTNIPHPQDMRELMKLFEQRHGELPALSFRRRPADREPVTVCYRQVAQDVRALANACYARGMQGAHCALIGAISYEWILVYYALQTIGAVVVPLDREWHAQELAATAASADCRFFFADDDVLERLGTQGVAGGVLALHGEAENSVAALLGEGAGSASFPGEAPVPTALSLLVFTSGTTGKGKGVMLSQHAVLEDVYGGLALIRPHRKCIMTLPPHHTYGSSIGFVAVMLAGIEVYLSSGLKYIQREMLTEKPDLMILVPLFVETFLHRIYAAIKKQGKEKTVQRAIAVSRVLRRLGIDLRRRLFSAILDAFGGQLSLIVSGGAPLRPELVSTFEDFGITLINGYGITECAPLIAANRNRSTTPGTVGYPLPALSVRIDRPDDEGNGEICVKGDTVMLGYYRDPAATEAAIDGDGYFHTGDIGRLDDGGRLIISGRSKNLIILPNGKNVYPEEIETDLSAIDGVADVVVYEGVSRRGIEHNAIVAELYPAPEFSEGKTAEELYDYFHRHIEAYNRTAVSYKKVDILRVRAEDFPKNTLRKIMRFRLDTTID